MKYRLPVSGLEVDTLEELVGKVTLAELSRMRAEFREPDGYFREWLEFAEPGVFDELAGRCSAADSGVVVFAEVLFEGFLETARCGALLGDVRAAEKAEALRLAAEARGPVAAPARKAGDAMTVELPDGVPLELVWCPPGTFGMGSPKGEEGRNDDEIRHRVTLTKGFWIGKYPVTQRQWLAVMGDEPPERFGFPGNGEHPAEKVSWDDICKSRGGFLAELNGLGLAGSGAFRLPTEAEWEYACRAGTAGPYNVDGVSLGDLGWYNENSGNKTHPVGQKCPNAWGLYDMHGNLWEWCSDWYGGYPEGAATDPAGPDRGVDRVLRGGSWFGVARGCRSADRFGVEPVWRGDSLGFRLALGSGLGS